MLKAHHGKVKTKGAADSQHLEVENTSAINGRISNQNQATAAQRAPSLDMQLNNETLTDIAGDNNLEQMVDRESQEEHSELDEITRRANNDLRQDELSVQPSEVLEDDGASNVRRREPFQEEQTNSQAEINTRKVKLEKRKKQLTYAASSANMLEGLTHVTTGITTLNVGKASLGNTVKSVTNMVVGLSKITRGAVLFSTVGNDQETLKNKNILMTSLRMLEAIGTTAVDASFLSENKLADALNMARRVIKILRSLVQGARETGVLNASQKSLSALIAGPMNIIEGMLLGIEQFVTRTNAETGAEFSNVDSKLESSVQLLIIGSLKIARGGILTAVGVTEKGILKTE